MAKTTYIQPISAVILLAFILLFSACKAKKNVVKEAAKTTSTAYIVEQIQNNNINAEWFSARARIVPSGFGVNMSISANIRIQKDKAIWLNAKKIGLEAGRALIRPDSIFILDRINRIYYARPIEYVATEYNLPADFGLLQDMILGNAVLLNSDNISTKQLPDQYFLKGQNGDYSTEYQVDISSFLLQKMFVNEAAQQRNFNIDFNEYAPTNTDTNFAHRRSIQVSSPETGEGTLQINFSKVEMNVPKSMPFSVSSRYTRG